VNIKPKFSIVIPIYNKGLSVERAIKSVLSQTYQDFEVLCICDPSTDNSTKIVESWSLVEPRLKIHRRDSPGAGGYAARNLGIHKAKANWVAFLDADDEWLPSHLENISTLLVRYPESEFFASSFLISENGAQVSPVRVDKSIHGEEKLTFIEYLNFSPFYTSVVVANRSLLLKVGGFPEGKMRRGGDVDTWLRAIHQVGHMVWSRRVGAIYHKDSENMVTKSNFYTQKEVSYLALSEMIAISPEPEKTALKIKANNNIIYAWNQNMHLEIERNFSLLGKLYFRVQPIKVLSYLLFSMLPTNFSQNIHHRIFRLVQRFRYRRI
jgi:glycosyltransferase involved in cell wall biosynthesis